MAISSTFHLKEMCDFCRVRWPKLFMELNDDSKTDLKRTNLIQKVNLRFIRTSLSCVCHLTDGCVATEVGINFYFSIVFCTISNQCACIICLRHRLLVWLMYKMPLKKRASRGSPLPGSILKGPSIYQDIVFILIFEQLEGEHQDALRVRFEQIVCRKPLDHLQNEFTHLLDIVFGDEVRRRVLRIVRNLLLIEHKRNSLSTE